MKISEQIWIDHYIKHVKNLEKLVDIAANINSLNSLYQEMIQLIKTIVNLQYHKITKKYCL